MPKVKNGGIRPDPRSPQEKVNDRKIGALGVLKLLKKIPFNDPKYLPDGEPQSIPGVVDDMSCCTHSALHVLETVMNYFYIEKLYRPETISFLENNGYILNGKVKLCILYTAIRSGTTREGNYFQAVWNSLRNLGAIPESRIPLFGGKTWNEVHRKTKITPEDDALALEFKSCFEIEYAFLDSDYMSGINDVERKALEEILQYAPVQIGVPIPCSHAIMQYTLKKSVFDVLDHYLPFFRKKDINKYPVAIYVAGYITERSKLTDTPPLARLLKIGMKGEDVSQLQANLRKLGYFSYPFNTGTFGVFTQNAVLNLQREYGLPVTGNYYTLTHALVYKLLNK